MRAKGKCLIADNHTNVGVCTEPTTYKGEVCKLFNFSDSNTAFAISASFSDKRSHVNPEKTSGMFNVILGKTSSDFKGYSLSCYFFIQKRFINRYIGAPVVQ
jgi:hypothetical protein